MNFAIIQLFSLFFLFIQFEHTCQSGLLKNVRNFAEEAVKGMELVKLSHYFVDYAHLNGMLMINKDQYEAIGEENEAAGPSEVEDADDSSKKRKRVEKSGAKESPKKKQRVEEKGEKIKQFKEVDKMQLSNHFSVTVSSTLLPSPYPKELFELAAELQPLMALLHFRASFNVKFLLESTKTTVESKSDSLVEGMVKIMRRVEETGRRNPITLIMQRSDYLTDEEVEANGRRKISLKQIEATNSIGKGQGYGHMITKVHQRVLEKVKRSRPHEMPDWLSGANVHQNEILQKQAEALYKAWKLFAEKYSAPDALILLIAVPKRKHYCHFEQLIWEQFKLEDIAWAAGDNPMVESITFEDMVSKLRVEEEMDRKMHLYYEKLNAEGQKSRRKVAIAYFQDGFIPEHFTRPEEWHIREQMEMSTAIMSPSVYLHLMGSKTVQHELAKPGAMEKYFANEPHFAELVAKLRGTFIEMWALGDSDDDQFVRLALANPKGYVLKTNTDGGKGNFFDDKMVEELKKSSQKERSKFILQKRITPFKVKNAIIPQPPNAEESIHFAEVDMEVSIYGSFLAVAKEDENGNLTGEHKILFNSYDGYGGRTKLSTKAQCNVSAGFGGMDSMVLFPIDNFENEHQ